MLEIFLGAYRLIEVAQDLLPAELAVITVKKIIPNRCLTFMA